MRSYFSFNSLFVANNLQLSLTANKIYYVVYLLRYIVHWPLCVYIYIIIIIINDTLARSLEPVVTECKEHTIHTQTQIVASRKPKEIKHTNEGEANFTT